MRRKPTLRRIVFELIEPRLLMASISGTVFNDLDGNGLRNSEPALANWTVFLDQNRDHVLNNGEASTTTNGSGQYTFTELQPANYTVAQVVPPGWQQTYPGASGGLAPAFGQSTTIPTASRLARDSDAVRSAIAAVSNLTS